MAWHMSALYGREQMPADGFEPPSASYRGAVLPLDEAGEC